MPTSTKRLAPVALHRGIRVYICPPRRRDADAFLAAVRASKRLHGAWVRAPQTAAAFNDYVARFGLGHLGHGEKTVRVRQEPHGIAGLEHGEAR